ncbi:NADH-quinone oxidoreductase subunit L [Brevibacillus daliensis]|uniref:NADH-quinone oxidoreductase subunit L n=1 Tax=Brevibacillus daliensis TaxID=2892995 RepID=UPI001E39C9DE|nr:NADH-quinone oxidoreductase subunit L [Brevibacillus daliensis]
MDTMMQYAWLVPLFPLIAFAIILSFGRQLKEGAAYISILFTGASLLLSLLTFWERFKDGAQDYVFSMTWLKVGDYVIPAGFEINQLNAMMLVIVTTVSLLVQIYSRGYMHGDSRFPVFYQYLALFTFAMLGLVISPNLLQVYIFWELVGACSFLLVGYYFFKPQAKAAAKKAFIVTRIGDVGLFIAICLLFWQTGSFAFEDIFTAVENGKVEPAIITLSAILIFVGAAGKSGQFPLHTWLPDAMEGPTPVSALIHAATMVAAGVYLVAASFPLFIASPEALNVVAYVGGFTAIFAATIGITQRDIKRVLAYSTVSQLGFMMMALGVAGAAGYVAGTFHLMTHAFFKALLFLAAGSVIHAVHTQDVFQMGGLSKRMPITSFVFLIGCLAIAGVPPFSGFWSKEEILAAIFSQGRFDLLIIAMLAAFCTAFYMFRLYYLTFKGEATTEATKKAHESPSTMTLPMLILAVLAIIAGFINLPNNPILGNWLMSGTVGQYIMERYTEEAGHGGVWLQVTAVVISLLGIGLAYLMYGKKSVSSDIISEQVPWLYRLSYRKYYIDEIYDVVFVRSFRGLGHLLSLFDRYVVGGIGFLVGWTARAIGGVNSRLQTGQLQMFGLVVLMGLVILVVSLTTLGGVPYGQ